MQKYCIGGEQNIIQISNDGLFLNLQRNKVAQRKFTLPETVEQIILQYQYTTGQHGPTVTQKPDSMLSIEKQGNDYLFQYVFDAKYRIKVGENMIPGPREDDINIMHRYRDSIVVERNGGYERTVFGAYVLFLWHEELVYKNHTLYESIRKVNIGGLPFLPNATMLVEQVIHSLLSKTAYELQKERILPVGTKDMFQYDVLRDTEQPMLVAEESDKNNYS